MVAKAKEYRWFIELHRLDGEHLTRQPIVPDWETVKQWAEFCSLRRMPDDPLHLGVQAVQVEPCFDPDLGAPYVLGLRAITSRAGTMISFVIPLTYFQRFAEILSVDLVVQGQLTVGEKFHYMLYAYPVEDVVAADPSKPMLSVHPTPQLLDVTDSSLDDLLSDSLPQGPGQQDLMPVFIHRHVLTETVQQLRASGQVETGGLLLGRLHRDKTASELFLEVTAQIPVEHAKQELTRLTFTPDTWAAADRAMADRSRGEMYVGWWHTHPVGHWRKEESKPTTGNRDHRRHVDFFSAEDGALHQTVFPRAYSVAVVLSDIGKEGSDLSVAMFGWHQGILVSRGFHVLGATPWQAVSRALAVEGE